MRKAALLAALVGAALFAWVIQHMGLSAILQQLKALRFALPILIALSLCRLLLQTVAWSTALKPGATSTAIRRVAMELALRASVASDGALSSGSLRRPVRKPERPAAAFASGGAMPSGSATLR